MVSTGAFVVIAVAGDVGALTGTQMESFAAEHPLVGCVQLTLDFADVPSLASAGGAVLRQVRRWCQQRGIELAVRGAAPSVERALSAAGLEDLLDARTPLADRLPGDAQELALF